MLMILLAYEHNAQVISDANGFSRMQSNVYSEYVLTTDIFIEGNYSKFSFLGVLDGMGHKIEVATELFNELIGSYIRNVTIVADVQVVFSDELIGSALELVRFENVVMQNISDCRLLSVVVHVAGQFLVSSINSTFNGCSFEGDFTAIPYALIGSSLNDTFGSTFMNLRGALANLGRTMSFGYCRIYSQYNNTISDFALIKGDSADEIGLIYTDIALQLFSANRVFGLAAATQATNFYNSSISIDACNISSLDTLYAKASAMFCVNSSFFLNTSSPHVSSINGIAGSLETNCFVISTYVYLNVSVLSKDSLEISGFTKIIGNTSTIEKSVSILTGTAEADKDINFAGMALKQLGKILDTQVIGEIVINYTAGFGSSEFAVRAAAASLFSEGSFKNVYAYVNISFATQKGNSKEIIAAAFVLQCRKCEISNSATFGNIIAEHSSLKIGISGFVWDSDQLCIFSNIEIQIAEIGLQKVGNGGEVWIVGLIYGVSDVKMRNIEVETTIKAARVASVIACQLFYTFEPQASILMQAVSVRVDSTEYGDISIGSSGYDQFTEIIVNCELENVNRLEKQCKTTEEMTDILILEVLSDEWAIAEDVNDGFPYCINAFLRTNGEIVVPDNSDILSVPYYIDREAHMTFVETHFEICRGVCNGSSMSPITFKCAFEANNDRCIVSDQQTFLMDENCAEDALEMCYNGAELCTHTAEAHMEGCVRTCLVEHGYCRNSAVVCNMNYVGSTCNQFDCSAQKTGCYGLGTCQFVEEQPICKCMDPEYLYVEASCQQLECPGLVYGICTAEGAICNPGMTGEHCDACSKSNYIIRDDVCVESNLWIIVAVVISLVVFLALLAVLLYLCARKYELKLVKRGEKYVRITEAQSAPVDDKAQNGVTTHF